MATSILMILGFSLYNLNKISNDNHFSNTNYFFHLFMVTAPFILLLGIIAYTLYLLIAYQNRINNGHVTSEYNTFSTISVILTLIQIYIFYEATNSKLFMNTGKLSKITYGIIHLVEVVNIITVLIIGTILKYFTTDG
jgi:hypothetical protein